MADVVDYLGPWLKDYHGGDFSDDEFREDAVGLVDYLESRGFHWERSSYDPAVTA